MGFLGMVLLIWAVQAVMAQETVPAAEQPSVSPTVAAEPAAAGPVTAEPAAAATAGEEAKVTVSIPKTEKEFEPYVGIITGERINIRSGPAEPYYPIGFLNKGDKVIVHQEEVVEVAAHLLGRSHGSVDVKLRTLRESWIDAGKHTGLNMFGYIQFCADTLLFGSNSSEMFNVVIDFSLHRFDCLSQ